jgi:Holliday junction DNA helicase RuvB
MSITIDDNKVDDEKIDRALRPKCFDDYIGQADLLKKLEICIEAAKNRKDPLDHILLSGPPGLGKTTIGNIIAEEYGCKCKIVNAPSISSVGDLIELLHKQNKNDILFIDEIHRLSNKIGEVLYPAMEDYKLDMKLGNKEVVSIKIKPFCLIGATTHPGLMPQPLRDRFGISYNMQFYENDELAKIIEANASKLNLNIKDKTVYINIAKRSRGIPRLANRLLRRVRDYAEVNNDGIVNNNTVNLAASLEGIDENGFSKADISYMDILFGIYNCGPVGVQAISSSIGEDKSTVEEYIEPFLVREGMIARTKQGRILTAKGMEYVLSGNKYQTTMDT